MWDDYENRKSTESVLAPYCSEYGTKAAIEALRAAGWIIVRHDAIKLAQAHARDEANDNKPTGYYVTEGTVKFVRSAS